MTHFLDFVAEEWILFAALIIISSLIIRSFIAPKLSGVKEITVQDALRKINDDDAAVLDVRVDGEFNKGHILNAIHIPLGSLESRARELEKYKSSPIIISCQTGNRSIPASQTLRKQGFESVYSLAGGMNAWINANLPVSTNSKRK
jgi:rhodanese-related sulfurtransferase